MKLLVEAGADVNFRHPNVLGVTVLQQAVKKYIPGGITDPGSDLHPQKQRYKIVSYLLQQGADVRRKDEYGSTAIDDARFNKSYIVVLLLSYARWKARKKTRERN